MAAAGRLLRRAVAGKLGHRARRRAPQPSRPRPRHAHLHRRPARARSSAARPPASTPSRSRTAPPPRSRWPTARSPPSPPRSARPRRSAATASTSRASRPSAAPPPYDVVGATRGRSRPTTPDAAAAIDGRARGLGRRGPRAGEGQFERFADALDAGTDPPVTLADARASIELITALYCVGPHAASTWRCPSPTRPSALRRMAAVTDAGPTTRDHRKRPERPPAAPRRRARCSPATRPTTTRGTTACGSRSSSSTRRTSGRSTTPYGVLRHVDPSTRPLDPARPRDRRHRRRAPLTARRPRRRRRLRHRLGDHARRRRSTSCSTARRSRPGAATAASSLRGRPDWTDTRLLLADGSTHERVLGVAVGLVRPVRDRSTEATAGVLLLTTRRTPATRCPWYGSTRAATYGDEGWSNFLNAAFLWDEPLRVAAGDAAAVLVPGRRPRRRVGQPPGARPSGSAGRMADPPPFPGGIGVSHLRVYDTAGARRAGRRHPAPPHRLHRGVRGGRRARARCRR